MGQSRNEKYIKIGGQNIDEKYTKVKKAVSLIGIQINIIKTS
jgi:hypothetical protein